VLGAIESDNAVVKLQDNASSWLRRHSVALGRSLSSIEPDLAGYALGALLAGPPWKVVAIDLWDSLVGPWLAIHGTGEEARHLLYKGLQGAETGHAPVLIAAALKWLASNRLLPISSFVLGPLLERPDLGERAPEAIKLAFDWLGTHGSKLGASFVFNRILRKRHLPDSEWLAVAALAVDWLDSTPDTQADRDHALYSLLTRPDLLGAEVRDKFVGHLVNWLHQYSTAKSADRMPAALRKLLRTLPDDHPLSSELKCLFDAARAREALKRGVFSRLDAPFVSSSDSHLQTK